MFNVPASPQLPQYVSAGQADPRPELDQHLTFKVLQIQYHYAISQSLRKIYLNAFLYLYKLLAGLVT